MANKGEQSNYTDKPENQDSYSVFYGKIDREKAILDAGNNGANLFNIFMKNEENDKGMPRVEPDIIKKEFKLKIKTVNSINSAKFTKKNDLFISTNNPVCAAQICRIKNFLGINVSCNVIEENYTTKFLIHEISTRTSLKELYEDILESNENISVKELRRFSKPGSKNTVSPVLVTIYGLNLPRRIIVFCNSKRIKIFIDRPKKCQKCLQIGHVAKFCSAKETICLECVQTHTGPCTEKKTFCVNCEGEHKSDDESCPKYIQEQEMLTIKSTKHLTTAEAKRVVKFKEQEKERGNYAEVTKKSIVKQLIENKDNNQLDALSNRMSQTFRKDFDEFKEAMWKMVYHLKEENESLKAEVKELKIKVMIMSTSDKKEKTIAQTESIGLLPESYVDLPESPNRKKPKINPSTRDDNHYMEQ